MKRWHLAEIIDQKWCPTAVREGVQDYLKFLEQRLQIYRRCGDRLRRVLRQVRPAAIIDLCSGGGGPWTYLWQELENKDCPQQIPIRLTDLYPNIQAFEQLAGDVKERIWYCDQPVDVTRVPENLRGFRTLFTAFHHFDRSTACRMLQDAAASGDGIAIFEFNQRHILSLFGTAAIALMQPLAAPFIRPFRWSRLFWTYVIPAIPFACLFDGLVSCMRVYSPGELDGLIKEADASGYRWERGVERIGLLPVGVTYLVGYPVNNSKAQHAEVEVVEHTEGPVYQILPESVYGSTAS